MRSSPIQVTLFNAAASNTISKSFLTSDYQHIIVSLATTGVSAGELGTIKLMGASSLDAPDFSAAQSSSNLFDYINFTDLNTGLTVDGSVGITINGSDIFKRLEVNANAVRWLAVEISGVSGTYTLLINGEGYSNV